MKITTLAWAKCWAHNCSQTAMVLLKFPNHSEFGQVWYCERDAKTMLKNNKTAKVIQRLKNDGNGHLIFTEKPEEKKP